MGDKTRIQWADASWNPLIAYSPNDKRGWFCVSVSEGCRNCYASQLNTNLRFGNGLDYKKQNRKNARLELHEPTLLKPLHWQRPRRIFTNSMTDIFGTDFGVTWEMLDRIYAVMALTPQHTYLNLTKRPQARLDYLTNCSPAHIGLIAAKMVHDLGIKNTPSRKLITGSIEDCGWPLKNVREGVSVEDQDSADERIPFLLQTPATLRFISYEPALGAVDFQATWRLYLDTHKEVRLPQSLSDWLHWIIIGGESGPNARPFNVDWARQVITQCQNTGVAVFLKQLGANPVESAMRDCRKSDERLLPLPLHDKKGGDESEWPKDLQGRRQFPR